MLKEGILLIGFILYGGALMSETSAPPTWTGQEEWERILAAAKKEGAVVISASSSELLRQALMEFEGDYPGIKVSYQSGNARDFWSHLEKEREVGRYLWDLRIGGVSAAAYQAKGEGILDPVLPLLAQPEVVDDAKWLGASPACLPIGRKNMPCTSPARCSAAWWWTATP